MPTTPSTTHEPEGMQLQWLQVCGAQHCSPHERISILEVGRSQQLALAKISPTDICFTLSRFTIYMNHTQNTDIFSSAEKLTGKNLYPWLHHKILQSPTRALPSFWATTA
uniref:Uncharacterized protein n=1 Tax=Eutreptiella gymnastica TaxID=73025 RepID=A0A7S4FQV5_9EUGL